MAKVIPTPQVREAFIEAAPYLGDADKLRFLLDETGYLFVRKLLPKEPLLAVRKDLLEVCRRYGWLSTQADLFEGKVEPEVGPFVEGLHKEYARVYDTIQLLESFHNLPHHENLMRLLRDLFGEEVLLHPRHIARLIFPKISEETTPPHQDYIHIRGTSRTLTVWFPLGDCPTELGGLTILAGSHHLGLQETIDAHGAGHQGIEIGETDFVWVSSEFETGDVLLFNSLTVHAGLPNKTEDTLRISMDVRAQPASEPVHPNSLLPHMNRITWDQVYSAWQDSRYQRYWEKLDLQIVEGESTGY